MDKLFEHQRRMQEQIDRLLAPQKRIQEQMDRLLAPQKRMQEQMDRLLAPQKRIQEQMDRLLAPQKRMQEQMDRLLAPQKRIQEQMDRLLAPQKRMQEQMDRLLAPQKRIQEQMEKWINREWNHLKTFDTLKQTRKDEMAIIDTLSEINHENLIVNQNGTISIEGEVVSLEEISNIYSDFVNSLKNIPSPIEVIGFIVNYAHKIKNLTYKLLLILIIPYM